MKATTTSVLIAGLILSLVPLAQSPSEAKDAETVSEQELAAQRAKVQKALEEAQQLAAIVERNEAEEEQEFAALQERMRGVPHGSPEYKAFEQEASEISDRHDRAELEAKKAGIEAVTQARAEEDQLTSMFSRAGLRADGSAFPEKGKKLKLMGLFKRKQARDPSKKGGGFFAKIFKRKKARAVAAGEAGTGDGFLKGFGKAFKGSGKKKKSKTTALSGGDATAATPAQE